MFLFNFSHGHYQKITLSENHLASYLWSFNIFHDDVNLMMCWPISVFVTIKECDCSHLIVGCRKHYRIR